MEVYERQSYSDKRIANGLQKEAESSLYRLHVGAVMSVCGNNGP
jgi:hypothetical protein